jgi:Tol biopolymer transport system component
VADGGRVIAVQEIATQALPDARQVVSWDGSGPALVISRAPDGALADSGIEGVSPSVNSDGTQIVFTSIAANLVPRVGPERVHATPVHRLAASDRRGERRRRGAAG